MRLKWILIIVTGLFVISVIATVIGIQHYYSEKAQIERFYDIDLPESTEVLYHYDYVGWFGEGKRISVVQMDEANFNSVYSSLHNGKPYETSKEDVEVEIDYLINTFLSDTPGEYRPDWENDCDIVFTDRAILIFDFDENQLILMDILT